MITLRILLFVVDQACVPLRECCSMHNVDTQCIAERGEGANGQRQFLCLSCSCLTIMYEFYFTNGNSGFEKY